MRRSRKLLVCAAVASVLAAGALTACSDTDAVTTAESSDTTASASATASPSAAMDLSSYQNQSLAWTSCDEDTAAGPDSECALVTVPLDYSDPSGETIQVAISRLASTDPAERRGILLTNPGGPGGRGLGLPAILREGMTPDVAATYDVIGMDTRGLGKSTPLDCGLTQMTWMRAPGTTEQGWNESVDLAREAADKCWDKYPNYLPHINTQNIARDLDVIRAALGQDKASYFGWSYGTFLGATYTQMFPDKIDRVVLDSAPDPAKYGYQMFQDMGPANEKAIDDFSRWAAQRDATYALGSTPAQVRAMIEKLVSDAASAPIQVGEYQVDDHVLPFLMYFNATTDSEKDSAAFAQTLTQLRDVANGKSVETIHPKLAGLLNAWFHTEIRTGADYAGTIAIVCGDVSMSNDPQWYRDRFEEHREDQPIFAGIHNTILPCAFWRAEPPARITVDNDVPALHIQATGDTRTTYEEGIGMHEAMRGSRLVTVPGRTHAVFPDYENSCANAAVNSYLLDGTLPETDIECS
ncbi:pimeloyl-ACP methyl ester carboxylesterase [Rhodococcus sp. 27YEA15]|uniref:alpha/beta hydrolase n=1 Tax=Rhodococcus sp. 27YEA15 TaxID=3156259 RepID=UPI003C7CDE31